MAGSTGTYFYDTEAMRSATQGFEQSNKKVMDIFREMMNVINSLKNNYEGDDADIFYTKFDKLSDDIMQIDAKIKDHIKKVNEIASNADKEHNMATERNSSLANDFI